MPGFSLISAVAGPYFPDHAPESVSLPSLKHLERGRAAEVRSRVFPPCSQFFRLNHFIKSLQEAPEFINAHTIETPRLFTGKPHANGAPRYAQGSSKHFVRHPCSSNKLRELLTDLVMSNRLHTTQFALYEQYCKQFC